MTSDKPFLFSVKVPEGNYDVTVTLGDPEGESVTTVKAESRRLMLEKVETAKGDYATRTFVVNVRNFKVPPPPKNAPGGDHVVLSYGLSLQHQGRMEEAINVFSARRRHFKTADVHEFLLYPLFHAPDRLKNRVSQEARKLGRPLRRASDAFRVAFGNERTAKRPLALLLGYVGPSFTRNQVRSISAAGA